MGGKSTRASSNNMKDNEERCKKGNMDIWKSIEKLTVKVNGKGSYCRQQDPWFTARRACLGKQIDCAVVT